MTSGDVIMAYLFIYGLCRVPPLHFPNPGRVRGYHSLEIFRIPYAIWCISRQSGGSYL